MLATRFTGRQRQITTKLEITSITQLDKHPPADIYTRLTPDLEQSDMSGPIVRTGTTPEYWKNWDSIFGAKKGKPAARTSHRAR